MGKKINPREVAAGLSLILIGLFVALYAGSHYRMGSIARMGPAYFPTMLGWLLVGLGVVIALLALRKSAPDPDEPKFRLRPLLAVLTAIAAFTLLVKSAGLVPAAVALTFISAMAEKKFQFRRTVLLSVFLAIFSYLVFTLGLQMNLPAFAFWK